MLELWACKRPSKHRQAHCSGLRSCRVLGRRQTCLMYCIRTVHHQCAGVPLCHCTLQCALVCIFAPRMQGSSCAASCAGTNRLLGRRVCASTASEHPLSRELCKHANWPLESGNAACAPCFAGPSVTSVRLAAHLLQASLVECAQPRDSK